MEYALRSGRNNNVTHYNVAQQLEKSPEPGGFIGLHLSKIDAKLYEKETCGPSPFLLPEKKCLEDRL